MDFSWNKNHFSINTLLNYIDTFWVEIWLAKINTKSINKDITKKYFPSINRKIKYHIYKTLLEKQRNNQEVLIYGFRDYELSDWQNNHVKSGFIAEKIVELQFRELANLWNYNISIVKWSIWEDQQNKVDLYIILQDKKTWVTIKDELQITLQTDTLLKEKQVEYRNKILRIQWDYTESQLINFTMKDLWKKIHAWEYFNRPIWKLTDTLDEGEKALIRETFKRLVLDLETKKEKLIH
jgi:hypothetical protein